MTIQLKWQVNGTIENCHGNRVQFGCQGLASIARCLKGNGTATSKKIQYFGYNGSFLAGTYTGKFSDSLDCFCTGRSSEGPSVPIGVGAQILPCYLGSVNLFSCSYWVTLDPQSLQEPGLVRFLCAKHLFQMKLRPPPLIFTQLGSRLASIAARDRIRGLRAHHTCRKYRGGRELEAALSLRDSAPSWATGSQCDARQGLCFMRRC